MKKKFAWEKWYSPLEDEVEMMRRELEEPLPPMNEGEMPESIQFIQPLQLPPPPPFGFISGVIEQNNFINSFDFWILHTNFDVTDEIKTLIESVDGVESISVLTRYRVKIGFTKSGLFNNTQIKQIIQNRILGLDSNNASPAESIPDSAYFTTEVQEAIDEAKEKMSSLDKRFWSFYVYPNGELSIFNSDSKSELDERVQFYQTVEYLIGGKTFYSTAE
jgi:hypothetical protein